MSANRVLVYLAAGVFALFLIICILAGIFSSEPRSTSKEELARHAVWAARDARIDKLISEIGPSALPIAPLSQPTSTEIARTKSEAQLLPKPPASDVLPTTIPINNQIIFDALPESATKGELTVSNGTSHHAVAKLIDIETDRKILSFAVCAGQKSSIYAIPDGSYYLIFAFGDRLYEGTDRFDSPHGFSKFVRPMTFTTRSTEEAVYWDKLSVTLHPVFAGNAKTSSISRKEFERY